MIGDLLGLALLFAAQGATGAAPAGEPVIVPGDVVERKAGEKADIFRLPVLADMDVKLTVDTPGDASATLYGADGKRIATTTGKGKLTLSARARGEGIYFLAISVAKAGTPYKVALGEPSMAWAAARTPAPALAAKPAPVVPARPAWMDKVTPLAVVPTAYGGVMPFPYGETISGNFAQAENRAAIGNAPTILYSFEGRKSQRVKAEVRTTAAHTLVSLARDPAAARMDIVSSDAQYKNEFNFDSVLDGYLPADGRYYVIVRAYASGPKGQRDLVAPAPSLGEFTIRIGDGGKRAKK